MNKPLCNGCTHKDVCSKTKSYMELHTILSCMEGNVYDTSTDGMKIIVPPKGIMSPKYPKPSPDMQTKRFNTTLDCADYIEREHTRY